MRRQIDVRKNNVAFSPIKSMEGAYEQEFQKGEISGIYQCMYMLPMIAEAIGEEILDRNFEENEEEA